MMKPLIVLFAAAVASAAAWSDPIDWEGAAAPVTGGRLVHLERTEPRLIKADVMRIDLKTPGLRFTGTHRAANWGEPMPDYTNKVMTIRTKRERTEDFMMSERAKGRDVIIAFNSAPWGPWVPPYNHAYGDPHCLNISEGVIISDHHKNQNHLFVAWNDGRCEITENIPSERYADVQVAHSGFDILMKDGKKLDQVGQYSKILNPRMVFGLSADGRYLFVMTIDGRQPGWSLGADMDDICSLMSDAGASDVVNMDGGGSSTLVYWDGEKPVMVNRHDEKKANRRKNGTNIAIYLEKK